MEELELGKFIKEKRADLGLTVRSLAEKAGVNNGYISLIENGKSKKPSPDILRKLSNSLELDYFSLMMLAGYLDGSLDMTFALGEIKAMNKEELINEQIGICSEIISLAAKIADAKLRNRLLGATNDYRHELRAELLKTGGQHEDK